MAEYKTASPNVEILGGMLASLWTAFPETYQEMLKKILAKHGVAEVVPEEWYRLQPVLDGLKEIEDTFGHHMLRQVGEQAASRAPIPPEINTLKACLLALNVTLHKFHRGGDVGGYAVAEVTSKEGLTQFHVTASTPFPCSLTSGYLEGYARRFKTGDVKEILVRHDETGACRRQGSDTCTYIVTCW